MSTNRCLKSRLSLVRADLDQALDHVHNDMLQWAPAPGMRSIFGQIEEIVGTEVQVLTLITTGSKLTWQESQEFDGDKGSILELRGWLKKTRSETLAHLDSLTEEDLNQPTSLFKKWFEGLRLEEVPLAEIFRGIAQHEAYHTGQLVSYLWARGDDPYKW
jgi:uncharacterized damage-inducible protein DinB